MRAIIISRIITGVIHIANAIARLDRGRFCRRSVPCCPLQSFLTCLQTVDGTMGTSAREIAELNIRYYRDLLKTETNPKKRETITQLLAEEEAKLRDADKGGTDSS